VSKEFSEETKKSPERPKLKIVTKILKKDAEPVMKKQKTLVK
jgi:hypothetical protein